jgi:maleylpyruvate isomerase
LQARVRPIHTIPDTTMKLYDTPISSACARVRIALALKGIDAERIPVSIGAQPDNRKPEYLRVNPQGLVPALLTDDGDLLTQSLAIVEYLEEMYPEPALLPASPAARARVRALTLAIAADTHPLLTFRVADYVNALPGSDAATMPSWRRHWLTQGLDAFEALLARDSAGLLCAGDAPTIADVFLYPQAINAERAGIMLGQWPRIAAVVQRLGAITAFAENGPAAPKAA